jgi:short-subunit dehydrogenase
MMSSFGGKLAVVTGASSGIGAAFARRLAREGLNLLLVARRKDRLAELAAELGERFGVRAEFLAADLSAEPDLSRTAQAIAAREDLEILVNNAGFGTRGRFFENPSESAERMHRLHVLATIRLTHAALAGMTERGRGSIVNVSSVAAFGQSPGNAAYCATKSWMNSFTEGIRLDLDEIGSPVRVQALCPGFTLTEFHDVTGSDRGTIPGSWWMTAEEVVDASLEGLRRGTLFVVPGWRYRIFVAVTEILPRRWRRSIALRIAARRRRAEGKRRGAK